MSIGLRPSVEVFRIAGLAPFAALLIGCGHVLAGPSHQLGFAMSALGALVALIHWRNDARLRIASGTLALAFTFAATPLSVACAVFAPVLALALWPHALDHRRPTIRSLSAAAALMTLSVVGVMLWWTAQPAIAFYSFLPPSLASSSAPVVPVLLCLVAAVLNATWEEALWRHLLVRLLPKRRSLHIVSSLGVLPALFGLAHLYSLPGGWSGVFLTTAFALAAYALIRWTPYGMLAALSAHVAADFVLLLLVTFGAGNA